MTRVQWKAAFAAVLVGGMVLAARADIRIGQTVGVTGAVAATVKESMAGARLYLDEVNARGGVHGEKVQLITLDDAFDVGKAEANARMLIEEQGVLALFMSRGTPHTEAIYPLLDKHRVALVAPSTGAMVLHQPVRPYLFHVRATYQREAERAMAHLTGLGLQRIAVLHVDDSFGADGLQGARNGLKKAGLEPVAVARFDRAKPEFTALLPGLKAAGPQAVLVIGSGTAVVQGLRALRQAGVGAQYLTLSNNASNGFIQLLGADARGIIVGQVMPTSPAYPLVTQATALARAQGMDDVSPALLEGFAGAKVLVEALRRAGPRPTRASVQQALDNLGRYDLGGLTLHYHGGSHSGLEFAELTIIGASGKFQR
ncbi:amino acid/amide ABC transporter substrate-binding protein, HAAT family [Oryzisolibacter propanilivorax]|uniref:Amino acid/amide ABC transporter substrate-binding protein, HAAT family n=1 Tax=Oryzisolibacter propanilivorax TaxID=1527607 RepID=A0A1G9RFX6_9BURK|nr:ABC transporter substrate-binding protein [Oryzisolibacter propanilivorax]SDM21960.1 amino acid/amide ABC transporter substrate-binding protein, HAAT family [Oryzisolibacter propanilivorax]